MQEDVESSAGVRPGDVLAGKYRIDRILGIGGMGVVVAAQHVMLEEKVAIKFLLPDMLRNQDVVGRFAREARAAVKIKSEHVARVFDVGTLENGAPYMVMEFLEGGDLAAWLRERGPLAVEVAVDFVLQACVAVANAHGLGVVHRDLKPANLFCVRGSDGEIVVKVLDFGISKITHVSASDTGGSLTQTSAVMGSPFYMSPEQMQSAKDVDARTDIWALGIVLYELLTGSTPFEGTSFAEIAIKVATGPLPHVRSVRPEVPAGLEAVILKCLTKDRRDRYAHIGELGVALRGFGSKRAGAWVDRIVGIVQASGLSETVANVESPVAHLPGLDEAPGTMAASARTTTSTFHRHPKRTAAILGIVGALVVVSVAASWGVISKRAAAPDARVPPAPSATVTATPTPAKSVSLEPDKPPELAVPPPPTTSATKPPAPRAPAKAVLSTTPPAPAPTSTCHVVRYFDADGETRFRKECP
jgi:serine/threonine protein kinase